MVSPAVAVLYPTLLASLASNPNYTLVVDGHGIPYVIDNDKPVFTQSDLQSIKEDVLETTFSLYTRNNPKDGQPLFINDTNSVKKSFWNPARPTRIVTHGWRGSEKMPPCTLVRDAYLEVYDYNIILVDWSKAAGYYWYWSSAESVPMVAQRVSELIDFLENAADLDPSQTKVIGFSLGGHVAGISARNAKSKIAEVVALDPAKQAFELKKPGERVDKSDANRVQVIHTSTLGFDKPIGDADFYPNGGKSQPGCGIMWIVCDHSRSYEYYSESILNPKGFRVGNVYMGGPSLDPNAHGKYILQTAKKAPYALG
ncbi:hypothetical protein PUN28_012537 [Cardiocondyla obscurior]|uniref:phospholipase A1 n=1 Tax=Cardiocondyla obscurior TaxID=286306 RepID=A0AAW2FD89_9HYME